MNSLPSDMHHIQSHAFQTALKTYLYKQHHNKRNFKFCLLTCPSIPPPTQHFSVTFLYSNPVIHLNMEHTMKVCSHPFSEERGERVGAIP